MVSKRVDFAWKIASWWNLLYLHFDCMHLWRPALSADNSISEKGGRFLAARLLLLGGYRLLNETGIGQRLLGSRLQVFRA